MNRISTERAARAPAGEGVEDVHELVSPEGAASKGEALLGTAVPATEAARPRRHAWHAGAMLIVLIISMIAATCVCALVAALGLVVWPAAVIDAMAQGEAITRLPALAVALVLPLLVLVALDLGWRSYARARPGRCADIMMFALGAALASYSAQFGLIGL